jgi:hypothetical protein
MASENKTQDFNQDLNRVANKFGIPQPPPSAIQTPVEQPSQLVQILDGWGNRVKDLFGVLDEETKRIGKERLFHCDSCHMRNGNTCDPRQTGINLKTGLPVTGCGCNISAKTLSPHSICPMDKW